ncbi:MAG: CPBP family intramembrane glutamic endopeptidase [Chloroflexota bacterium]
MAGAPVDAPVGPLGDVEAAPRTRRGVFELEGRTAPGLYLLAWGLVVAGLGAIFSALAAGGGSGAAVAFVMGLAGAGLGLAAGAGSQALQRRADGAVYAGPSPVPVFVAAFLITLVVGFALGALNVVPEGPLAALASVLVSAVVSLGLVGLVVVGSGALGWGEMGLRLPGPGEGSLFGDVAWGIALAVPTLFGAAFLAAILVAVLGVAPTAPLPPARDPGGVLVNLLVAALLAPFWEELFFRGFATTAWARTAGPRAAIVRGAVFFALIHVITLVGSDLDTAIRTALIAFAIRLPVGLVLGWVFLRRRTLAAPIALHATYNAIPVLLVALGAGATPS